MIDLVMTEYELSLGGEPDRNLIYEGGSLLSLESRIIQ